MATLPSAKALGKRREPESLVVVKKVEAEKRVTRSAQSVDEVEVNNGIVYLPFNTRIILSATRDQEYESVATIAAESQEEGILVKPSFRLLPMGESFTKSRNSTSTVDTSDAQYIKLHRYPDLLEKRSAKAEREALIHQRSKLIIEIEEMKSRGWIYQSGQGGKSELERLKKLDQAEERLKRYDALLPGQPRKAGFLNSKPSASTLASHSANNSRSNSPSVTLVSKSHHSHPPHSNSTAVSATSNGSTTIKIVFRGSTLNGTGRSRSARRRKAYHDSDTESELEESYLEDSPRKRSRSSKSIKTNNMMDRDSSSAPSSPSSSSSSSSAPPKKKSANPDYLIHTFHSSTSLQSTLAAANKQSKTRRSTRLAYAFGNRLPELALAKSSLFELIGGIDDESEKPLEDYCREREGCGEAGTEIGDIVVDGIIIPKSSIYQD